MVVGSALLAQRLLVKTVTEEQILPATQRKPLEQTSSVVTMN